MTAKTMAEAQQEQAKAKALGGLTGPAALAAYSPDASKYLAIQQTNTAVAQQVLASHPNEPFAANVAQSIAQDTSKPYTLADAEGLIKTHTMEPLEVQGKKAEIAKTEAGTAESEASTLQKKAETLRAQAQTETEPLRRKQLQAQADAAEARAKFLGAGKPMTDAQIETAARAEASAQVKVPAAGFGESLTGTAAAAKKKWTEAYNAAKQRMKSEAAAGKTAIAAAPELPEGWTAGEPDADGRPTAVDPSGVPHHWEE
jgi:hypothetical protein